jgi:hypothetical protein
LASRFAYAKQPVAFDLIKPAITLAHRCQRMPERQAAYEKKKRKRPFERIRTAKAPAWPRDDRQMHFIVDCFSF